MCNGLLNLKQKFNLFMMRQRKRQDAYYAELTEFSKQSKTQMASLYRGLT